jgi:chromosomal replication initiation ATPase DnaA
MDQFSIEPRPEPRALPRLRGPRRSQARTASQTRLFQAIKAAFAVGCDDLCIATRGRCDVAFARQTGMYLARVALGMTLSDAGLLFGRDRTTAAYACRLVEDLRDDPQFDALLNAMEAFVLRSDMHSGSGR